MELNILNVEFCAKFLKKKKLSGKIRIELDIGNIMFQNRGILLHSLKSGLLGYMVQKVR